MSLGYQTVELLIELRMQEQAQELARAQLLAQLRQPTTGAAPHRLATAYRHQLARGLRACARRLDPALQAA